ncbi:MAG: non-canonical purine NTP pyrophosphatase, RdgB/HAM1 family [Omnitrophica bacterium GWA2_41_15]|nr:MAG: non-canonical purine NTP pyrophosphatase, RdgB/HAM1 family [Omnitrophica bacterium GWA2_41_15]HAZ10279.1 non-canonical purine NTP pyrophosphatase, RdgB/HAM1 family [Candidatus Omnitrophota bacterium]
MKLVVATRNKDKLKEIKALLKGLPVKAFSLNSFKGAPDVIEDGSTLEENARKKAAQTSRFLKKFVVADDSGLEVEFLNGDPGVYSARFSGKGATYKSNNEKLLRLLKDAPPAKRKACFKCVIAVADKGKVIGVSEGRCNGKIGFKSEGDNGFGYDPLFIPDGFKKTFAQMSQAQKNKISHRSIALTGAKKIISNHLLLYL